MLVSAMWGMQDARRILYGSKTNLTSAKIDEKLLGDLNDSYLLVRRVSTGALIIKTNGNTIWFVPDNLNYVLSHDYSDTPFKGLLCEIFKWCPEPLQYKKPVYMTNNSN